MWQKINAWLRTHTTWGMFDNIEMTGAKDGVCSCDDDDQQTSVAAWLASTR